jgi:hypothetical protein
VARGEVPLPFGGGIATTFAAHRAPRVTTLDQTGFRAGRAFLRADGSLLVPGAVDVVEYTGEGVGFHSDLGAAAAITGSLRLDPSFGGAARPARISLTVPRQRAARDASRRVLRVAIAARASGPGLCLLEVRAGRRVIARSTAPVYVAGRQRLRALLTLYGRRRLRHAHHLRVSVRASFRDVLGARTRASARGVLR